MAHKLLFLLLSFPLFCSGEVLPDSIPYYFMRQAEVFPQEDIYMQTDRTYYMAGDTVWFNIYAVEAVNHTLDSESSFAYVDLADKQKRVVDRIKVRKEGATFKGYMALDGNMDPGDYTLNVYTRYMQSEQKKFFSKRIRIGSYLTEKEEEKVKTVADYEVGFFPEGGQWIEGELSLVAFKALNSDGLGEDITGMVLDAQGDTVVRGFETTHLGMGTFPIIYDSKKQYQVVCRNRSGLVKNYDLPMVKGGFWALKAKWNRETLFVGVQKSAGLPDREDLYLTVQCRGKVYYSQRWDCSEEFLRFSSGSLPTGVLHLLLTDKHNVPVSERLVFNWNRKELVSVSLNTDKDAYAGREQVKTTLDVKDEGGQPLSALLSVAVTDGRFDKGESEQNILSALLLSSDLKGYVESPAGYFTGDDFYGMQGKVDLLMMTQGWSRYRVDSLLVGKYRNPGTTPEKVQEIKGRLYKGLALNKPAAGDRVALLAPKTDEMLQVLTDDEGRFCFTDLMFEDRTRFIVHGYASGDKWSRKIQVDTDSIPCVPYSAPCQVVADAKEEETHLMNRRVFRPEDIDRFYELEGIEISASRIQKDKPGERKSVYTSDFNRKITTEELSRMRVVDMYDLLQRVPGVGVWNNSYPYLKKYYINTIDDPAPLNILINNQPTTPDELNSYLPEYVTSIEVIADRAGALGTAYAMKKLTMAGTLLIMTSTKPVDMGSKELESMAPILPWGYQVTKEFYSPRYEVKPEAGGSSVADNRPTLYWNPDIRVVGGKGGFDFYTSDYPHGYQVVVEGIADDGRLVYWHGQLGD